MESVNEVNSPVWLDGLIQVLPEGRVYTAEAVRAEFGVDRWHASAMPDAVVQAESREEVAATLRYANENKIPVTTRGAGVGYVGGCVPVKGGILLSVRKMDRILEINPADGVAVVTHARPHPRRSALRPSSLSSSLRVSAAGAPVALDLGGQ